jgi:hypothetical protein
MSKNKTSFKQLEERLNLDVLNEMHMAFIEADSDGSGTLELEEFKEVVKNALKIQGRVRIKITYLNTT